MIDLLEHNKITVDEVESFITQGKDCCVVNPCGSGKTYVMAAIIENHMDKSFVIITKQANAKSYYQNKESVFRNVKICTYMKLLKDFKEGKIESYNTDFLILDEAHYMGASQWIIPIGCIKNRFKPIMLGFTATPKRFNQQGTNDTIITEFFNGNSAGNFTSHDLQKKGLFIEPECIVSYYHLDDEIDARISKIEDSELTDNQKITLIKECEHIKTKWQHEATPDLILKKYLPGYMYKATNNRILVYSPDVDTLNHNISLIEPIIRNIFTDKKIRSYIYTYKSNRNAFTQFLSDDDSYVKILFSIDKIMETIHIDDLNIILMLRPSVSDRIITQQYGRVNSTSNPNKSLIIDFVGNINKLGEYGPSCNKRLTNRTNRTNKTSTKRQYIPNTQYVTTYVKLFEKIDQQLKLIPTYKYNGFEGSLSFLAKVFDCDLKNLYQNINLGLDIEDAILNSKKHKKINISSDIINAYHTIDSEKLNEYLSQDTIIDITERFIERKHIKDEDMRQDLYLYALTSNVDNKQSLLLQLNSRYTTWSKQQRIHNDITVHYDDDIRNDIICDEQEHALIYTSDETMEQNAFNEHLIEELYTCMTERLTQRECIVLICRFGLDASSKYFSKLDFTQYSDEIYQTYFRTYDEIGRIINVTRTRIGQIEAKAISKIRRRAINKELDAFLAPYETKHITVKVHTECNTDTKPTECETDTKPTEYVPKRPFDDYDIHRLASLILSFKSAKSYLTEEHRIRALNEAYAKLIKQIEEEHSS